ncbi:hypothetical protein B0E47_08365 [Rhodanobacter sp. B05]|uniref:hypothetical protein n=1 Tax=Rhodanobacter sp. B05 TaxID=1945859 RepID=UPI0009857645|nr:hypothetical protein [Rhodanobacter sp. B05]OOG55863.1 hypothetical protein B0E47_08365 [Rhodanobacter sp. B05]
MTSVLFDSNVYDLLAQDSASCAHVRRLVASGNLRVIVTRTVAEELAKSPFGGVPDFFAYEYVGNSVGRVGVMRAGDSIGSGSVYDAHLGNSEKANDAFVTDAASWHAEWLVSQDKRLRKRASEIGMRAKPMEYSEFVAALNLQAGGSDV